MKVSPLKLTDAQMAGLMDAARHLRPNDRSAFLRLIAGHLRDRQNFGDGDVYRIVREALVEMEMHHVPSP